MLIKYKNLSVKQIEHLEKVFYQRKLVSGEKAYSYYFNDKGVCEYAE